MEEKTLKTAAYQKTSDYFYKKRAKDMKILRGNFCNTDDIPLEQMIYRLYNCISSVPFFGNWIEDAKKKFGSDIYMNLYTELLRTDVYLAISITVNALRHTQMLDFEPVTNIVQPECDAFTAAASECA